MAEIIEALLIRGGLAHRQDVADHIAASRAGRPVAANAELQVEVFEGFQRYLDLAATKRPAPLLHQPLGTGNHCWVLTRAAEHLFMRPNAMMSRQIH